MGEGTRVHVPGLDGLRGIAVVAVVAYHLGYLGGGFVGVDLFFVLSGFLITSLLLDEQPQGARGLGRWWGRRVRRLTPAVGVVVLAVLVVFGLTGLASHTLDLDAVATLTWWQNWHLVLAESSYWGGDASPLRHAWSLSIEEQFYLLWPPVLVGAAVLARRRGWAPRRLVGAVAAVGAVASFLWAARLAAAGADLSRVYFGTDTRLGGLLLGCAAAAVVDGRPTPRTGRAGTAAAVVAGATLAVTAVVADPASPRTYWIALPVAAAASLVLVLAASFPGPVETALSPRPLQWLGVRSYAIYLWSWPVQVLVQQRWDPPRPVLTLVTVAATLALAELSLRLVERPLRVHTGWARAAAPRRLAWVGGTAAVLCALVLVARDVEAPTGLAAVSTEQSAELALRPPPTTTTSSSTTTVAPPADGAEVPGDTNATGTPVTAGAPTPPAASTPPTSAPPPPRLRLAVFGDSLAFSSTFVSGPAQLHPAGIEVADGRGYIGCWLLSGDGWSAYEDRALERPHPLCAQQRQAEQIALSARPDWVVHFAGGWEGTTFIDPAGTRHEPQSPQVRAAILTELVERGNEAAAAGARIAWPAWVCPGVDSWLWFADGYAHWFNDILREASRAVPGSIVIEPTERVCIGGDAAGAPTAEKDAAWEREHHPHDGAWLWQVWLGPALWQAEGRPNPG